MTPWHRLLVGVVKNKSWAILIIRSKGYFCFKGGVTLYSCLLVSDASQFPQMNAFLCHPLPSMPFLRCLTTCDYFVVLLIFFPTLLSFKINTALYLA